MNIDKLLNLAIEKYQAGTLQESESFCREILKVQPDNIDALHILGLLNYQKRYYDLAIEYFQKILQIDPTNTFAYFNLANSFREKGNFDEAITYYLKALQHNPNFEGAYYNLGLTYKERGRINEAIAAYQKALQLNPDAIDVYNNLGLAFFEKGLYNDAKICFQKALQINSDHILSLNNLGLTLKENGELNEAIACFEKAIRLNPNFSHAYFNLGIIFQGGKKLDTAITYFQRAIEIDQYFENAYYNLGIAFKEKGQLDKAIDSYQKVIELNPSNSDAYNNVGLVLKEKGQLDKALTSFRKAIQLNSCDPEVHWNMSLVLLASGNFKEGWKEYEWRYQVKDFQQCNFSQPRWDGSSLKEKSILVYAEQGVGDEIMFASCLPEVIAQADLCVVECDKRLIPLFNRSFPRATMIERNTLRNALSPKLPPIDMKIAAGSLPLFFRHNLDSFPQQNSYLIPDAQKVDVWRDRLTKLGAGLKVGISWRGGSKYSDRHARSIPLEQWAELFFVPEIHFINLQYGDCLDELRKTHEKLGVTIHDWEDADPLNDLDGFAAQIASLDLVISVDNATVHMAGALGVPVWTLLPFACDWRWMREFEDTPWYRTVRLYRQNTSEDWNRVLKRVSSALKQYITTGATPSVDPRYSYGDHVKASRDKDVKDSHPLRLSSSGRTYRCAVVTPVGPGHEKLYDECLASVEKSFHERKGSFSEFMPIRIDDLDGRLGRSKTRNSGIKKAVEHGAEWIFFLDADDIMSPPAFEYVSPYLSDYDAIWGSTWVIEKCETEAKERPNQLPFLYSIEDVLSCDPFVTLQMGHFIKTSVALSTQFNETLNTGEDFDFYLRVWKKYRCIKISLPFFYNRRGYHSKGPRSATGHEWRQNVENIMRRYTGNIFRVERQCERK